MPPPPDPEITLKVLVEGTPSFAYITIKHAQEVDNIITAIVDMRDKHHYLKDAIASRIELWKVDIDLEPFSDNKDALCTLKAEEHGTCLLEWDLISRHWPQQPSTPNVQIIARLLDGPPMKNLPRSLKRLPDLSGEQEEQVKRYRTVETPSAICKIARSMRRAQEYAKILNGRPWNASGPPVGLFHPIFDCFRAYFNHPSPNYRTASSADDVTDEGPSTDDAFRLMRAFSEFYEVEERAEEPGRVEAILPDLRRLLGIDLKIVDWIDPGAQVAAPTSVGIDGLMGIFAFKLEPGIGGDAMTQAQRSYAKICSLPKYDPVRLRSCCPSFLVGISGPWITVLGAVYIQKVIVQHLVGPLYLSPQQLHPTATTNEALRLFYALGRSFQDLRNYYSRLPSQVSTSRLFPHAQSYVDPKTHVTMNLDYITRLSDESTAVYLAKVDDAQVVVKFASTYCIRAHNVLAEKGLAPKIIYDGSEGYRYGGLIMIVMEYVKGETMTQFLQSSPAPEDLNDVLTSVTQAIDLLHADGLVFGDLRTPNILIKDGSVKLIDFDWAGVDGEHRYPFIVGDGIDWAKGVGPLAIMYKKHDLFMLKRLKEHIQAGDDPGVW